MKRTVIVFVLLVAVLPAVFAQNPTAVIRETTGTVELQRPGSSQWVAAKAGDVIEEAVVISTGFRSTALLSVGNSTVTVRALTRLSLRELLSQDNTETVSLNLSTGRIRAEVGAPAGSRASFSVQTNVATASVRGTVFEMDAASIRVAEGAVSYASSSGPSVRAVTVSAGQESAVNADSGRTVTPMAVAETTSAPPPLPGQTTSGPSDGGARLEPARGSVTLDITLNDGNS